jgi:hypothetical protein
MVIHTVTSRLFIIEHDHKNSVNKEQSELEAFVGRSLHC